MSIPDELSTLVECVWVRCIWRCEVCGNSMERNRLADSRIVVYDCEYCGATRLYVVLHLITSLNEVTDD